MFFLFPFFCTVFLLLSLSLSVTFPIPHSLLPPLPLPFSFVFSIYQSIHAFIYLLIKTSIFMVIAWLFFSGVVKNFWGVRLASLAGTQRKKVVPHNPPSNSIFSVWPSMFAFAYSTAFPPSPFYFLVVLGRAHPPCGLSLQHALWGLSSLSYGNDYIQNWRSLCCLHFHRSLFASWTCSVVFSCPNVSRPWPLINYFSIFVGSILL